MSRPARIQEEMPAMEEPEKAEPAPIEDLVLVRRSQEGDVTA